MTDPVSDESPRGDPPARVGAGGPRSGSAEPAAAPADALLEHVVDDTGGWDEAAEWAAAELLGGRPFEDVSAALVGQGWPAGAAGQIVEDAREATRRGRGVRTREDVARGVARRYALSIRLTRWLVVAGIAAVIVIASMFMRG